MSIQVVTMSVASRIGGARNCLLRVHSAPNTIAKRSSRHSAARITAPCTERASLFKGGQHDGSRCPSRILTDRNPATVPRLIVAIVIDAVNRKSLAWSISRGLRPSFEAEKVIPVLVDGNPPSSIAEKGSVSFVCASVSHGYPNCIQSRATLPMVTGASARFRFSCHERIFENGSHGSAIAARNKRNAAAFAKGDTRFSAKNPSANSVSDLHGAKNTAI
jgi:hypothetical protein